MLKSNRLKYILIVLSVISSAALILIGRIPQDVEYHQFADAERIFGILNFHNIFSNLPFLFVGMFGLIYFTRNSSNSGAFETILIYTLFSGIALICFGSAYYHSNPNNFTLVWDRLPMTLVFSSLFSVILTDYIDVKTGRLTFAFLLPAGIFSVFYWYYTELNGIGDLRPYLFIQFFPMICIPIVFIFSSYRKNVNILALVFAFYLLAKIFEIYDDDILELLGFSGHSMKHLFAAIATYLIYVFMKQRRNVHI